MVVDARAFGGTVFGEGMEIIFYDLRKSEKRR